MKKDDSVTVDIYEGKIAMEDRLILLLTGFLCWPIGFALYFYFKDKSNLKYHAYFSRISAWAGFIFFLVIIISLLMFALASCLAF
ncbi:MAG: hypothetical protein PUC82_01650 [bacterium]|nr:hypothetical protein [bacterium]